MNRKIKIGSGGYFSEYKQPLYSLHSTKETIKRQLQSIKWYSQFGLDVYVFQDQLISKNDAKCFRDVCAVEENREEFIKLGNLVRHLGLKTWVHTSHFVSSSSPSAQVREMTKMELLRFKKIISATNNGIRYVTTHIGGRYKNILSYDQAVSNSISLLNEVDLGPSLCIENDDDNGKLGSCEDVLLVCESTKARPLLDIPHFRKREKGDYFSMLLKFASYWPKRNYVIVHYGNTDSSGNHSRIDWSDFRGFCRKILKSPVRVAIDLETPQEIRLKSCLKAKEIINELEKEARYV